MGSRFCNACAAKLEAASVPFSPESYTPKHAAEDYFPARGGTQYPAAAAHAHLSSTLGLLGEFEDGARHGAAAIRIAEAREHPYSLAFGLLHLAWLEGERGDFPRALALGSGSLTLCREGPIPFLLPGVLALVGYPLAMSGQVREALPMVREAVGRREAMRYRSTLSAIVAIHAEICRLAGQPREALEHARRALALARECGELFNEARALRVLGDIYSGDQLRDSDAAARAYTESVDLAGRIGMQPFVAHGHLGLGKLHRRSGATELAEDRLRTAIIMYREMGMPFWLERAQAELQDLV